MTFIDWMEGVVRAFEAVGVIVLVLGSVWAFADAGRRWMRGERVGMYKTTRQAVGRSICSVSRSASSPTSSQRDHYF